MLTLPAWGWVPRGATRSSRSSRKGHGLGKEQRLGSQARCPMAPPELLLRCSRNRVARECGQGRWGQGYMIMINPASRGHPVRIPHGPGSTLLPQLCLLC